MSRWSSAIGRKYDVLQQNADANMLDAQSRRNLTDAQVRGMPATTDLTRARTSALNTLTPTEAALNNARAAGLGADASLNAARAAALRSEMEAGRALFPERMDDVRSQIGLRTDQGFNQRQQGIGQGLTNDLFRRELTDTAPPMPEPQQFRIMEPSGRVTSLGMGAAAGSSTLGLPALPRVSEWDMLGPAGRDRRRRGAMDEQGFALGTEYVQPMPAAGMPTPTQPVRMPDGSYSFGGPRTTGGGGEPMRRSYAKGTARVPGKGDGTRDTVPAKLAPGEAVLNRPAADMAGRGLIAALNALGAQKMGMV